MPDTTSIDVTWNKMGSEFTYEVLYSKIEEGPWIRHHDFRLDDDVIDILRSGTDITGSSPYATYATNVYTIDGLDKDTIYYVLVRVYDKHHQWWYSYSYSGSLGGGQSQLHQRPSPDDGNIIGLQFNITI